MSNTNFSVFDSKAVFRTSTALVLLASLCIVQPIRAEGERGTEQFCLTGEFDLGVRLQGKSPSAGEFFPTQWCVVGENHSERVHFAARGHSNADMEGEFALSYLPPHDVRIVNASAPPDLQFQGAIVGAEALRHRRIDPKRLVEEIESHPEWILASHPGGRLTVRYPGGDSPVDLTIKAGHLESLQAWADLPLRGRVPVLWRWTEHQRPDPKLELFVDGALLFRARGRWRTLSNSEAEALWQPSDGQQPREIPGQAWPSRTAMSVESLAAGVHLVLGVRTGFHHLVVETRDGLVVGDAPAGWVEVQQIPPADLAPGMGISGLSERFIDFLNRQWPGQPIRAVALTHAHDDHAGGARAFAAAGAQVYAPKPSAEFLERALNRNEMPIDRLASSGRSVKVLPVVDRVELEDPERSVELLSFPPGPHVDSALGLWVPKAGVFFQSDLHVPNADSDQPRSDRLLTECWFARWAVENLPKGAMVLTSHGTQRSTVDRLARYLETESCSALADSH
jgi:glyoxylase-like metal-dependent hydrolase (beta-lactamase superfamily II)